MRTTRLRWILGGLLVLSGASMARAQDLPAVEAFAGYSLLPANGDDFPRGTSHGVQLSVAANLNRWFGVVGEFGSQWDTARDLGPNFTGLVAKTTVREYLIGPRFTARAPGGSVFAHGWFGSATGDAGDAFSGFSDSALAFGGGGGVDVDVRPKIAIRAQYDLLGSFADIVEGNQRFALGVVWKLGQR